MQTQRQKLRKIFHIVEICEEHTSSLPFCEMLKEASKIITCIDIAAHT